MSIADLKDQWLVPHAQSGCIDCMFACFSCGTHKCFPTSFTGKFKVDESGTLKLVDNRFCFCLRPSPIPCCNGCGVGPCAQAPVFKKETETKWVGTGDSILAGGCCVALCHNKGDIIEIKSGKNGTEAFWTAGNSPAYPPCFQGKTVVSMTAVPKKGAAKSQLSTPAPTNEKMANV